MKTGRRTALGGLLWIAALSSACEVGDDPGPLDQERSASTSGFGAWTFYYSEDDSGHDPKSASCLYKTGDDDTCALETFFSRALFSPLWM